MQANQRAQALLRIGHRFGRIEHPRFGDVHGVVHQAEQNFVFALKMVIEAALAQLERSGNVVHRGGVVALQLKQARCRPKDFLPWIRAIAGHGDQYTRDRRFRTSNR